MGIPNEERYHESMQLTFKHLVQFSLIGLIHVLRLCVDKLFGTHKIYSSTHVIACALKKESGVESQASLVRLMLRVRCETPRFAAATSTRLTPGTAPATAMPRSKAKAACHCWAFSQALMAALKVITLAPHPKGHWDTTGGIFAYESKSHLEQPAMPACRRAVEAPTATAGLFHRH